MESETEKLRQLVCKCKNYFQATKDNLRIIIVANRIDCPNFYTINETMDNILHLCQKHEIECQYFLDEIEFNKYIVNHGLADGRQTIIYNRSLGGPVSARRILVPAVCSFNSIAYTGNDAYRMGLLCNKCHYYPLMKSMNVPVADYWIYDQYYGWLQTPPPNGLKVIMKLANENAAEGITSNSVFYYKDGKDTTIHHLASKYNQQVVIQKFITGYEVTVPVFIDSRKEIYVPGVIGCKKNGDLRYGDHIISSDNIDLHVAADVNSKYFDFADITPDIIFDIQYDTKKIVECLGITSFSRFDLRIDDSFDYYFNDIASVPGILPHSSYSFIFERNGLTYEDFLITTLCLDFV